MPAPQFRPLNDTTRRAEIVTALRRAILNGTLGPGQKVNELRIATEMQVSRAPLREAVRELVQEGVLTSVPYTGTFVTEVTAKDIQGAYSFNQAIETYAIELCWPRRDLRFFAELDSRHEAVRNATRDQDTAAQIAAALQFHGLLYEWSENSALLDCWQRLTSRLQIYFALHYRARNVKVPGDEVHLAYVDLLKGDDMAAAQREARAHIEADFETLLDYARSLESAPPLGRSDGARAITPP